MLFLRSAELVLRSSVLTVLDLDEMDVTLKYAEIFGSMLPGEEGGSADGLRCCRIAPGLSYLPPATPPKNPPPFITTVLLLFVFVKMRATKKVQVYVDRHQHALSKGPQLVLTAAKVPPKVKKEEQQRVMRILRVVQPCDPACA